MEFYNYYFHLFHFVGLYLVARTKTFIRKRRRTIIDIGYGSYCTSFTGEQKHKKVVPEYIGGA
jgi:hypothetical protein